MGVYYDLIIQSFLTCRETFKGDYEALQGRLCTLPDQLTHDVMVGVAVVQHARCVVSVWVWLG